MEKRAASRAVVAHDKADRRPTLRTELRMAARIPALAITDGTQQQRQASAAAMRNARKLARRLAVCEQGQQCRTDGIATLVQGGQIRHGAPPRLHAAQQERPARQDARQARDITRQRPAFRPSGPATHRPGGSMAQARLHCSPTRAQPWRPLRTKTLKPSDCHGRCTSGV